MKKQEYQKPAMRVVLLQHQQHLLQASVTEVNGGDTGIGFGGGSSGGARSRSDNGWFDDEE